MKWGYKRAFVRCALLFLAGAALQLITGGLDNSFLRHPWGLIISINYLYLLILAYAKSDSWTWVRKLYDRHAMTSSLAAMVVMCIIFGLTAQNGSTEGIAGALGFRNMKASWSFGLIFFYFTSVLGLRAIDDIRNWRSRRLIPSLSHAAVFLVLAGEDKAHYFVIFTDQRRFLDAGEEILVLFAGEPPPAANEHVG